MPIRSLILDHLGLKIFSLILGTLIWMAVRTNFANPAEADRTFTNRPILVLTDNAEHSAVVVNPNQASVTVRGSASLMQLLKDEDVQVFVRLSEKHHLTSELPVHVHVPAGATVVLLTPATAAVKPAAAPAPPAAP